MVDGNKTIIYIYINKIRGTQKAKGETQRGKRHDRGGCVCVCFNKLGTRKNKSFIDQVSLWN